jgi:mRNA interferase MazF
MTRYKFGDIVLVPFPFTDQTSSKQRPAIVVSGDRYNREHPDVIVMAITSQQRPGAQLAANCPIGNWQAAGLLKPSVIKPIVMTLEHRLILKTLGKLDASDLSALQSLLQRIFETP